VQQQMYLELKEHYPELILGNLTYTGGSVHLYEEHFDLVSDALQHEFVEQPTLVLSKPFMKRTDNGYESDIKVTEVVNDDYKKAIYDMLTN